MTLTDRQAVLRHMTTKELDNQADPFRPGPFALAEDSVESPQHNPEQSDAFLELFEPENLIGGLPDARKLAAVIAERKHEMTPRTSRVVAIGIVAMAVVGAVMVAWAVWG